MACRLRYAILWLSTLLLGLAVRFAHFGLPHAVTKYGGSALWAAAIYWLISLLAPKSSSASRLAMALLFACAIELFKLVHTPALAHFRSTLAGKLLLGRVFSMRDLLAYTLAICIAASLDVFACRARR